MFKRIEGPLEFRRAAQSATRIDDLIARVERWRSAPGCATWRSQVRCEAEVWDRLVAARALLDVRLNVLTGIAGDLETRGEHTAATELARTVVELLDVARSRRARR